MLARFSFLHFNEQAQKLKGSGRLKKKKTSLISQSCSPLPHLLQITQDQPVNESVL